MAFEFNPDGSLKFPEGMMRQKADAEKKMRAQRCISIKKELVSSKPPKKCVLHITLSDAFLDSRFVETIYKEFRERSEVMSKLIKINDKEFDVEIETCFSRCSDCSSLISSFGEFLDGNVIERKGSCTYAGRNLNFSEEDYF
jgi:hypothetical protein